MFAWRVEGTGQKRTVIICEFIHHRDRCRGEISVLTITYTGNGRALHRGQMSSSRAPPPSLPVVAATPRPHASLRTCRAKNRGQVVYLQDAPRRLLLGSPRGSLFEMDGGKDCMPYHDEAATRAIRRAGRARCARRGEVNDLGHGQPLPTSIHKHRGMKAVKSSAFVGRVDVGGGSAKHLETSLQQLFLSLPPVPAAAGAALPAAACHMPRSTLAGLLSRGLDAAAIPAVRLLTYRVLAQGKALAPHVLAAPDLVERLVACVLSELGKAKEEGGKGDGKDGGDDDAEEGASEGLSKENGDVGVWALRALLSTMTDTHLVVLLRYVKCICMCVCVRELPDTSIHRLLLVSFLITRSSGRD